jgi:hypothetical protein
LRQSRNYGALHETHRQVDEQQQSPAPGARQPRHYGALHETQHQVDEQRNSPAETPEKRPERPAVLRSWTHHGGMVSHQDSANNWIKQNHGIRMAESDKNGTGREAEGAQPSQPNRQSNEAEVQEARAAVEEARRREAAERARLQERERSGPER